ncbi:MAG TPA: hypothetical protein PLZ37_06525 [Nitrospira sp.]|nr:hypothetical protein [Nitrospira sp.]
MTFRVGMKVTMISPWPPVHNLFGDIFTEFGIVYTVREVLMVAATPAIYVAEIHNPPHYWAKVGKMEQPFPARNFRPVQERKTDISIFTAMLNPSQVTVDAMNTADFARESAE